ncbi:MAG: DUF3685 domain-containing protein [Microcoleaceae cyanobacterium]
MAETDLLTFWQACQVADNITGNNTDNIANIPVKLLQELIPDQLNLIILDIEFNNLPEQLSTTVMPGLSELSELSIINLCQQLKTKYPNLAILILTASQNLPLLLNIKPYTNGYCPKGVDVNELIKCIKLATAGKNYWFHLTVLENNQIGVNQSIDQPGNKYNFSQNSRSTSQNFLVNVRKNLATSSIEEIENALKKINQEISEYRETFSQVPQASSTNLTLWLNWLVMTGQRRELLTAKWFVSQIMPSQILSSTAKQSPVVSAENPLNGENSVGNQINNQTNNQTDNLINSPINNPINSSLTKPINSPVTIVNSESLVNIANIRNVLFDNTTKRLQSNLTNLTKIPLEIDILRLGRKKELIYLALRQVEIQLDELIFSQVTVDQLLDKRDQILENIWQATLTEFIGKYYTLTVEKKTNFWQDNQLENIEVLPILLGEISVIQASILDKIPLVHQLFCYLLFSTPLVIDNETLLADDVRVMQRAEFLLQNLILQISNAVMQPILNYFADVEEIKQKFYDRHLLSTREIEKFRNNLSWKYRLNQYFWEPQAIFESSYSLLYLTDEGMERITIYAPRRDELVYLSGVPLGVTLILETRDAIAPGLQATLNFLGKGLVYLLTQVVGKGIGLIGRGIIQGVGSSWQDIKQNKNKSNSPKSPR